LAGAGAGAPVEPWEETRAPGENPRLSAERWLTLFTWVHSENRTHDLRGERRLLWRLSHRSPKGCLEIYMSRNTYRWIVDDSSFVHCVSWKLQGSELKKKPQKRIKIIKNYIRDCF
jgi:hypothetical protein